MTLGYLFGLEGFCTSLSPIALPKSVNIKLWFFMDKFVVRFQAIGMSEEFIILAIIFNFLSNIF